MLAVQSAYCRTPLWMSLDTGTMDSRKIAFIDQPLAGGLDKAGCPCPPIGNALSLQKLSGTRRVSKTQRPLREAQRSAAAIMADLAPSCARIQVAGSVRRRKEVVGDIELMAIPRYAPAGLFGDCTANLLWEHLHAGDAHRFTKGDHPA